jgi:hypothetical protein
LPELLSTSPLVLASRRCLSLAVVGSSDLAAGPPQPSTSDVNRPSAIARNDIAADHAIVEVVTDDDRALRERLAALEAEVKADADARRARKEAAVAKLRDQRAPQAAEHEPRAQRAEVVRKRTSAQESTRSDHTAEPGDRLEDLGGALELASKANRVKKELQRTRKKGEKSWVMSGVASLALGPIGWLYAGSWREAVPATALWLLLAAIVSKLPVFLLLPALMVALPLSAIAGVVYALQYNRSGSRQRLFDRDKDKSKPSPKLLDRG